MNIHFFNRCAVSTLSFFCLLGVSSLHGQSSYDYLYKDLPFEMPVLERPVFRADTVSVLETGGVPDGHTLNTAAFEQAMETLAIRGGGTLFVPDGIWFTGPIVFRSNVEMHLESGALILFSPDFNLYPLVRTSYEGLDTYRCQSPISGKNLQNIAITGRGAINGSGEAWRPLKKPKASEVVWKRRLASAYKKYHLIGKDRADCGVEVGVC